MRAGCAGLWAAGLAGAALLLAHRAAVAQDSLPPVESGVRVGITYVPGSRPAITVLRSGAPARDSVRAILERDIDQSDRFEVLAVSDAAALGAAEARRLRAGSRPSGPTRDRARLQYRTLAALGLEFAVELASVAADSAADATLEVRLHDVRSAEVRHRLRVTLPESADAAFRRAVHRLADEVVRWTGGTPGIADTQILFVREGRIVRVDADGEGLETLRTAGQPGLSPAWSPDGRRIAYTAFVRHGQPLVIQDLSSGRREVVPGTEWGLNITPEFSPDGERLAFAHGAESGTDIYVYDLARGCCLRRLTVGRFADNLSPTWSPDGQRIAFISTRPGTPQLYVMAADGTGQEVLARFDFGATGSSNGPAWSPDGQAVAFHREVRGVPQVFVVDLATRAVRQITGTGRNEDPTWAPDSRHLAFVSTRTGSREIWVVDLETGRLRQLTSAGGARLPFWSPRSPPTPRLSSRAGGERGLYSHTLTLEDP